jgi:hypothetical protein
LKAYKIVLMVVENENVSIESIKEELSNVRHIYPTIMSAEEAEIGEWSDDHPLNHGATQKEEFARLFPNGRSCAKNRCS